MRCPSFRREVQFVPQKWQQTLGQPCTSCKKVLQSQEVISLCQCYLICHQQCFLKQFSPYLFDREKYICLRCQQEIRLAKSYYYRWQCNKKPFFIFSLVLTILAMLALIIMNAVGIYQTLFSPGAGYGIVAAILVTLLLSLIFSMRKKYINIQQVRAVNTNILSVKETDLEMKESGKDYLGDLRPNGNGISQKGLQFDIS